VAGKDGNEGVAAKKGMDTTMQLGAGILPVAIGSWNRIDLTDCMWRN
jgi:hypothetical protein